MSIEIKEGTVTKGIGGLYEVDFSDGTKSSCKARGLFRHENETVLTGDFVKAEIGTQSACIKEILPRKNSFIRPPMANLDVLFVVIAATNPMPALDMTDKLISAAEYNKAEPVIIVTKSDIDDENAEKTAEIYRKSGFDTFIKEKDGDTKKLFDFVFKRANGKISAFAGASGVGKTTVMNSIFKGLSLETGETSRKTERGKHTTKKVELFRLSDITSEKNASGYIADTPGFSLLDFVRFDFFPKDELVNTFREFDKYLGKCRYTKCTHTKEDGCAVIEAVKNGDIPPSRHESYIKMREEFKNKKEY